MHVNLRYQVRLNIFMLLITIYMIHIYFIYIFKCNLVYNVFLMCNDTYVLIANVYYILNVYV